MDSNLVKKHIRSVVPRSARNWLRSPLKSAGWLVDGAAFSFGFTKAIDLTPDLRFICHPRAYKVYRDSQIGDPEQNSEFRAFLSYCSSSMFLYDIGAHFGIFSLTAARYGGKSLAVDPSPRATRIIKIEASLNQCADSIRIVCAAVGESNKMVEMVDSGVFSDGYFKSPAGRPVSELTRVQSITIDDLTARYGPPTHIKIDVEGNEAAALKGANNTLGQYRPQLFIELHNEMVALEGGDPNSALDLLAAHGYVTISTSGKQIGRAEILGRPIVRILAVHT